ncbi:type II secretion system F family protein [soil metagenome]
MATFQFVLRDGGVKPVKGTLDAPTYAEALSQLRKREGIIVELNEVKKGGLGRFIGKKGLNLKERIIFTEQLAVMLNAGITLLQALKSLEEEAQNKKSKRLFGALATELEGGTPFSKILEKYPESFSDVYSHMVKSAEKSGNLADILMKLTEQQRKEYDLKGKVKGALIYPAVISVLMVGVITLVVTFVIPRLSSLFTETGTELPWTTKLILGLSDFMITKWYVLILGIFGVIFGLKWMGRTKKGRRILDTLKLKIPVIGNFTSKAIIARFAQTFSFLSTAGVPVLEIFETLKGVMGNAVYADEIERMSREVENGTPLSTSIRKSKRFPAMVAQLVKVGEQSGDLAGMFKVLGNFFEKEVDTMAKNLSTILEPIIMIIMGAVIGFILVAVLQPIYGLINAV